MLVAVVPVESTRLTWCGKNVPEGTPTNVVVEPPASMTATSPPPPTNSKQLSVVSVAAVKGFGISLVSLGVTAAERKV
jgi:hypothetical protein